MKRDTTGWTCHDCGVVVSRDRSHSSVQCVEVLNTKLDAAEARADRLAAALVKLDVGFRGHRLALSEVWSIVRKVLAETRTER